MSSNSGFPICQRKKRIPQTSEAQLSGGELQGEGLQASPAGGRATFSVTDFVVRIIWRNSEDVCELLSLSDGIWPEE